jgi:hypothetical protein
MKILSQTIYLISLFQMIFSFERGLWRGTTLYYQKGLNNKLDFNDIYYNYNISKFSIKNNNKLNHLNLRLKSYDKIGGVITSIPKTHNWIIDNNKSYISEINFFQDTKRSLIIFNYTYNNFKKLELNSIKTSALRCGGIKNYNTRLRIINISIFLNLMMKFNYCKTTIINPYYPNSREIKYSNEFDYKYFFTNEERINNIFTDNLIISIPSIINDYKPFSFIIGCFISPKDYKQLNINYNYNGILISIELNEYKIDDK